MASVRQRQAIAKVAEQLETTGQISVSQAMRDAGYPEGTAKNPQQLTQSKAWKDLMEEYLPDDLLAKVHVEGLAAMKISSSMTEPDRIVPDFSTRHKYLDSAYKLKGSYAPEKSVVVRTTAKELAENAEALKLAEEFEMKLMTQLHEPPGTTVSARVDTAAPDQDGDRPAA
jgi:hypothetical protein